MEINRHNYEAFLLDQLEGRLSVEQQQELDNFLLLNPDCARELSEIEPWTLRDDQLQFQNSDSLKKDFPNSSSIVTDQNFDLFSIARMEGDLTDEQVRAHQDLLEADDLKTKHWIQWQQTRLEGEAVSYPRKGRLLRKKGSKSRMVWMSIISAAAAVSLLIVLFRTVPDLPEQESYMQAPQEESSLQNLNTPPAEDTDQTAQAEAETAIQEVQNPVPASIKPVSVTKKVVSASVNPEPELKPEPISSVEEVAAEQVLVLSSALSAEQFSSSSMAREAVPDRIEPLNISPVPIHFSSLSLAQISDLGLQEMMEGYVEEKDLSLWKIADAGIKGINKLTGSNISLMASRDEDGEVSGFRLRFKRISLNRPLDGND